MASGNRASMREGPLAQLFRKTEEEAPERARHATRSSPRRRSAARGRSPPRPRVRREPQASASVRSRRRRLLPPRAVQILTRRGRRHRTRAEPRRPDDRGRPRAEEREEQAPRAQGARAATRACPRPRSAAFGLLRRHPREHPRPRPGPRPARAHRERAAADDQAMSSGGRARPAGGGSGRRRCQRGQPDGRGRGRGRGLHRRQHRRAVARGLVGRNACTSAATSRGSRLRVEPRSRPCGGHGGLRRHQEPGSRARTWSSSPPAREAAPAPARPRWWRASRARSAR